MDILLLTPPGSLSFNLPLGTAKLYAYLHKHKVDVVQENLGLEFFYYVLRPENISKYIKRIYYLQSTKKINRKYKNSELKTIRDFLINNIDAAPRVAPLIKHTLKKYQLNLRVISAKNYFFGGTINSGDLLVVEDFIRNIKQAAKKFNPDLIILPSSPFNLWGRDIIGRNNLDIEREIGIPVEFVYNSRVEPLS
ncbi:MAG: hypothetical protein U9R38_05980 [Candidatus Margulisiibacteriota bacterium]|nr:hypothetical protein [Candidatus Margulisiibacteriota bacterium]